MLLERLNLSLLSRPRQLALNLLSINHRQRVLSLSVAIVSGPETVLGCLALKRAKEGRGGEERKEGVTLEEITLIS